MGEEQYNIKFVQIIEKFPCLYNCNIPEYARKDLTEKACSEVATEIQSTVSLAKEKWRNLRSVFVRKRKLPPSGSGKKGKPYYLSKYMDFIIPFIKTHNIEHGNVPSPPSVRDAIGDENEGNYNVTEQEDFPVENMRSTTSDSPTEATIEATISQTISKTRKADKLNEVDESLIEFLNAKKRKTAASEISSNPRRQFLESLLPEVDEMPEITFRQFKRQVLQLIDRLNSNSFTPIPFSSPTTHSLISQTPSLHYSNPSSVASSHIVSPEPNLYELPPVSTSSIFMPANTCTQSVDLQSVVFSPLSE